MPLIGPIHPVGGGLPPVTAQAYAAEVQGYSTDARSRAMATALDLAPVSRPRHNRSMLTYHTPLDAPALRALGIPDPWGFGLADRVRFGELDALGHVNHTAYLRWFESFRLPYLEARHVTDYGPTAPRLVLRSVAAQYHAEMFGSTDYVIAGRTVRYRRTSFTMEAAIFALPDARLMCSAEAVIVLLNRDGEGRFPIPETGIDAFTVLDGAEPDG